MNVVDERAFPFSETGRLSCLYADGNGYWGMQGNGFCRICTGGTVKRIPLCRSYDKMAYCPETQTYWGLFPGAPGSIFVLDSALREIDCLRVRLGETDELTLQDIWYDEQRHLLWLVTKKRIYRFNRNGDGVGIFFCAPHGTEYRAVCTFGNFVFVAAFQSGCLNLLSYTIQGVSLEHVCLGGGYSSCNLQVSPQPQGVSICVFTIRDHRFPVVLEVEGRRESQERGSGQTAGGLFSVECVSETPGLQSTCAIQENK